MAKKITVNDDINNQPGAKERRFSIDGVDYEIDLTNENYKRFLSIFHPYIKVARVAKQKRRNAAPVISPEDRASIRAWAIANGRQISNRGRFPNDVVRDYYANQKVNPAHYVVG